jgi:hypothetical protein
MRGRAWRRHQVRRIAAKRRPLDWRSQNPDLAEPTSDNELATRHPFDCGSRCLMCHEDKLLGKGRRRAQLKRETARESLAPLGDIKGTERSR